MLRSLVGSEMCIRDSLEGATDVPQLSAAAAESAAWRGLVVKENYQVWYSGPSLYSVLMFVILLEDTTYSKTLSVAVFVSLFGLVQSVAGKMGGFPTCLVSLDSVLSAPDELFGTLGTISVAAQFRCRGRSTQNTMAAGGTMGPDDDLCANEDPLAA
eukprot:TRINITY_DN57134_c0_g1_i1.p1 TRINITY_DN57134_c0_g1~~TRINITY_DN57134_c0_g1_i1.p1  ORF type:complete len:181 (-),score=42.31 TRINITY_DN57134_c0_g1_i1:103-573(-)